MKLSERILQCKKDHPDWTMQQIADEVGCAPTTVSYNLSEAIRNRQKEAFKLGKPPPRKCNRCGNKLSPNRQLKKFCARCANAIKREQSERYHRTRIAKAYGLLPGDYEAIFAEQNERCAICQRAKGARKRLAVDHDHRIGDTRNAVRGLLCSTCNTMIGHARDDPEFFRRAVEYLLNPPARRALFTKDLDDHIEDASLRGGWLV